MNTDTHLEGLNTPQREAVTTTEGPLLVLAGAGSGKTRVITHRIVHLIIGGVSPHNILAVTFTNKAAKEMRERVHALIAAHASAARAAHDSSPTVTTFHALGVRILREHHEVLGLRRHFIIYDRADSNRAIKKAIEKAGHTTKEFEPRKMLSMISRAKGDAISRTQFLEDASSFPEKVCAEVWRHYDKTMKEEHALDFDDLLFKTLHLLQQYPVVLETLQNRYQYIHIDEYQDTNKVQFEIARLLVGTKMNICAVGDIDQCLIKGTKITMSDGSKKAIEVVKKGEFVLSNYGSGDTRPAKVVRTYSKNTKREGVKITTMSGNTLTSTPEHIHFAGYVLGASPQVFFTYLMWKEGMGWRIGTTSMHTKGEKNKKVGFVQRSNQEHADAVWILATHDTSMESRTLEYTVSLQYQIPTLPFVARKGLSSGGYVHDQKIIDSIFSTFDTEISAKKLLKEYGLSLLYPHHRPQSATNKRQNILISLCGDRRGKTPMHRISIAGSDQHTKKLLVSLGLSIRHAKKNTDGWRYETANKSLASILKTVGEIQQILPDTYVQQTARLGKQLKTQLVKNALPLIPAASIRVGMAVFDEKGNFDIVTSIKKVSLTNTVHDIDIEHTHNFIANNITTHNSIYSWRGADMTNVLQYESNFPNAKTVFLEENYRSTGTIIAASNSIIEKNKNRIPKTVFTSNHDGEKISLHAAHSGPDEAEYIVMKIKELIADGASPSAFAILYRTNFQSRVLEEAFLNYGVPYQLLGTKFFERKEIKDVLSYLRLALNPNSTADITRIINTPTRGIGKVTMLKVVEGRRSELKGATLEKVQRFDQMMQDITDHAKTEKISETLKFIIKRSGIEADLKKHGTEDDLERLENLRELVTLATRYDELGAEEGVEALIENAALQSDQDELQEKEESDAVRLMTIHSAKGLEFPYVFVTGLEEGLFPHERLDSSDIDNEEERRLFYVALTRAEKRVFLTYAHVRMIFGQQRVNMPSSFLNDIPTEYVEADSAHGGGDDSGYQTTVFLD